MFKTLATVASLLVGVAILLTGQGLQSVLFPVRANLEGFSTVAVGFIGASYFLGFTVGCWRGTVLIRNVGHVRVFAAMTALASAAPLLMGLWVNLWTWGILRLVTGYCFAVLYVVIESWLNESATDANRGMIFSAYILINMTVLAVGQQMLIFSDPQQLQLFAVASVLVSLAAVPVALSTQTLPRPVVDARLDFAYAWRKAKGGMVGSLSTGLTNGSFWALSPVFVAAYSRDIATTALFMTAGVLGGAAGQFPLGHLSDRIDRRYVMLGVSLAGALVSLALWFLAPHVGRTGLLLLGFAWGAFAFPLYSISVAHANDRVDPDRYVMISSVLLLMYGIGAITGPFLASGFMALSAESGLYGFCLLSQLAAAGYLTFGSLRRKAVRREDLSDFDDALTATLTASRIYEREQQESQVDEDAVAAPEGGSLRH